MTDTRGQSMSDLQTKVRAALVTWDLASEPLLTKRESDAIIEAARKYANLTRETQYGTCTLCRNNAPTPHDSDAPLEERWLSEWVVVADALGVTEDV